MKALGVHTDHKQHDHSQRTPADSPQAIGLLGDFWFGHGVAIIREDVANDSTDFAVRLMSDMRLRIVSRCASYADCLVWS